MKQGIFWTESNSYSHPAPVDTEPKEPEKEKENQSEDASLVPISKLSPWFSSRKEKKKYLGLLMKLNQEDLVQREQLELENFMEFKR